MGRHERRSEIARFRREVSLAYLETYLLDADLRLDDHPLLAGAVSFWYGNIRQRKPVCCACKASFLDDEVQAGGFLLAVPPAANSAGVSAFCHRCFETLTDADLEAVCARVLKKFVGPPWQVRGRIAMTMHAHPLVPDLRGKRSDQTLQAIAARSALLREAARLHCAGMSDRQAAAHLHTALARYAAGRWRRSRVDAANPHAAGTLAASMWSILQARAHTPSTRSIRRTLAAIHGPCAGV
jgi:hypothetical protein